MAGHRHQIERQSAASAISIRWSDRPREPAPSRARSCSGGRKVALRRPRVRAKGEEVPLPKTQASLPSQDAVLLLLFGLLRSGQVKMRKIDGW